MSTAKSFVENNIAPLRRITQLSSILVVMFLLLGGQFGLDLDAQSLRFFGNRIWTHETGIILLGLAIPFVFLAGLSLVFGRAFCGWLCPQTALCELAGRAQKMLVDSRGRGTAYRAVLTAVIGVLALAIALSAGLALVSVLVSPQTLLRALSGEFTTSLLKGITVASLLVLVDVGLLRHTFCEWMCVFGWWQRLFGGPGAVRVAFATGRARECVRCSECKAVCFMRIDPRRKDLPGSCLNCGKCITACKRVLASVPAEGLIGYRVGKAHAAQAHQSSLAALGPQGMARVA
ncbi:MAG: 4Fe-4S binding protein, partial [Chloroflexi bacterium]|nr:4Fe-4S binding protein [Chloroflexota bacterium]